MDGLTIGRIVHFITASREHLPAIITKVWSQESGCANLRVFRDLTWDQETHTYLDGTYLETSRNYAPSQQDAPGTWHWIERA